MCHLEEHEIIRSTSDFLDVISNCPTDTVVLNKDRLHEDFFELRTRLAGECLQKITNYRMRLVILGSFDNIESRSLRDFIYESNKNGKTVFAEEINSAIDLLR
ncbi:MAG: DUF4180 domain-containing protein [Spirochaetes bacterium]|nr:DUF4180 domain-containing protein [Spirochaetota bacterium]